MNERCLAQSIEFHLRMICNGFGNRHVGSLGNRQATDYAERVLHSFGFKTQTDPFACIEWEHGAVQLEAGGTRWPATAGPYSLPFEGEAELIAISSLETLANAQIAGKAVLLHGEIAREQIMPKNFVFYNPDHHKQLVSLLEAGSPAVLLCATGRNPGTAGGVYPFPLFEDGDFDIPSVTMKDVDGARLLAHVGSIVHIGFDSRRLPATATNVLARTDDANTPKLVLCAHIDAKKNTPGALDNGTGVAVLLGLAELLSHHPIDQAIEIALFNGEDYYAAPGQMQYLAHLGPRIGEIDLAINLDAAGCRNESLAYSFYGCPEPVRTAAIEAFSKDPVFTEGKPWFQGDHSMFAMAGRPAIALTSDNFEWLCREITHTPKDSTDRADPYLLAKAAFALERLLRNLDRIYR